MSIYTTGLIYFSPTQTTRKVIEGISQGLKVENLQRLDLTPPDTENLIFHDFFQDLAIIGSPVYSGRLPAAMVSRLQRIKGNGTPAVIVVVYGNRAYEDALIELRDLALEAGFNPIAAGAFIGEHSYSTTTLPIAAGRPDDEDIVKAKAFGEMIRKRVSDFSTSKQINLLQVPGTYPYKDVRMLSEIAPAVDETQCTRCKKCISICPTAAIQADDPILTDKGSCIRCCACIKICPTTAKAMDDPRIKQATEQLNMNFSIRKEPELYL